MIKRFMAGIICCMATAASYAVVNCPAVNPDSTDAVVCMTFQGSNASHLTQLVVNGKVIGQSCTTANSVAWIPNNTVLNVYHVGSNYQTIYQCGDAACKQKILVNTYTFELSPMDAHGKYNAKPAYDTIKLLPNFGPSCASATAQNQNLFLKNA